MPVKRRTEKRRFTEAAEADAWETVFETGRDFFRDLKNIGVEVDAFGLADVHAVKQAWLRLGHLFLASHKPGQITPWALRTFGDPSCR